jgi:hypothetical protein
MSNNELTKISIFDGARVRKILFNNEWYFSVVDICAALVESSNSGAYWRKLKQRLIAEGSQVVTFCHALKLKASDGKKYATDCANTEGVFRIIQSIPSAKAEPFKQWLAKIGKERIDEIENPELGIERVKSLYEKKGYPKDWIEKRLKGMAVRQKLTDEWEHRGANKSIDYAILTNDIMQGAFELKVEEHKKLKGLENQNLRDHMTDLELIITMLGEATTTQISQQRDSQGIFKLRRDAKDGGAVAGRTRKDIEVQIGTKVISEDNFLTNKKSVSKKIDNSIKE